MRHIRWTPAAADDLESIVQYIKEDNREAARQLAIELLESLQKLPTFPSMGRSGQKPGTRELPVRSYIIIYRVGDTSIEVLRIWHGRQSRLKG